MAQIAKEDQNVETLKEWLDNRKKERETYEREEQITFEVKLQEAISSHKFISRRVIMIVLLNLIAKQQMFKRDYLN